MLGQALALAASVACSPSPERAVLPAEDRAPALFFEKTPTGRIQFTLVPDKMIAKLSAGAFLTMKGEKPSSSDPELVARVGCIVDRLVAQLPNVQGVKRERIPAAWEVVTFDADKTINAFAMPGGKIGVYSGILQVADNSARLAAVLGHEIGHVLSYHSHERMTQVLGVQAALFATDVFLTHRDHKKGNDSEGHFWKRRAILGALGLGAHFGMQLPFSRSHELEADRIGIELAARAGFDPREAPELWHRWESIRKSGNSDFMSTHPAHEKRAKKLEELLPAMIPLYEAVPDRDPCASPLASAQPQP